MILESISLALLLFYSIKITFSAYTKQIFLEQKFFLVLLFSVHFLATIFAYQKISNDIACDANRFYQNANNASSIFYLFSFGSGFLSTIIYPFVKLKVTMFFLVFLFSTVSYRAFLWYYESFVSVNSQIFRMFKIPITQWFLLLPSLHFWSSFLSKDALVFFLLTYIFVANKDKKKTIIYYVISVVLIAFIRPYVFVILLLILIMYFLLNERLFYKSKIFFITVTTIVLFGFIPVLFKFIRLDKFSYQGIREKYYSLSEFAKQGGSGINILEINYVERIVALLFRPIFFDAQNDIFKILVSLENLIILLFIIVTLYYVVIYKIKFGKKLESNLSFYAFTGIVLIVSTYIYNLGLASRMRLMFYPLLFYAIHDIIFIEKRFNKLK